MSTENDFVEIDQQSENSDGDAQFTFPETQPVDHPDFVLENARSNRSRSTGLKLLGMRCGVLFAIAVSVFYVFYTSDSVLDLDIIFSKLMGWR